MNVAALSPFARGAPDLIDKGFSVIPCVPHDWRGRGRGKAPGRYHAGHWSAAEGWQRFRDERLCGFPLTLAMKADGGNLALVMGSRAGTCPGGAPLFVCAVDVDSDDPDAVDSILSAVPRSAMRVVGRRGVKIFLRAPDSIRSRSFDDHRIPQGSGQSRRLVDLLTGFAAKVAVVAPSIHPETGAEYRWEGTGPVRADELPIFDEDALQKLVETLQTLGYDPEGDRSGRGERKTYTPPEGGAGDDVFSEVKRAALTDLDAWVPELNGLGGLRRARGGWEAVNLMRPSSTNRHDDARKRNLSVQRNGISDFGTGQTWSAIDLVCDCQGLSVSEAVSWLEALIYPPSDVVIDLKSFAANAAAKNGSAPPAAEQNGGAPARCAEVRSHAAVDVQHSPARELTHDVGALPPHLLECPGLVGDLAAWMGRTAQRPLPAINLLTSLALVATAGGRKFAGPTEAGLVIYGLGLAGTGSGKAHPIRAAQHILNVAGLSRMQAPSVWMSGSALLQHVHREPVCVSFADEVAEFFAKLNGNKSSSHERQVSTNLRELYGVNWGSYVPPAWAQSGTRSELRPIQAPSYSFIGYSVPEAVWEALQGSDIINGFLNRFLLVTDKGDAPEQDPDESVFDVPETLVQDVRDLANIGGPLATATCYGDRTLEPLVRVPWADGKGGRAHTLFKELRRHCQTHPDGEKLMKRTAEIAVRLATVRAIGMNGERAAVTVEDMDWARGVALWSAGRMIADAEAFMSESEWQQKSLFVLRIIREAPGKVMTRTAIYRRVNHRFPSRDLDAILSALIEAGQVVADNSARTGQRGPKAAAYQAV